MTFSALVAVVIRPFTTTFCVAFASSVLVAVAGEFTVAPDANTTEPRSDVELDARRVTFLLESSLFKVEVETFEFVEVAIHTPVVPTKRPVVSVDPETTLKVLA